MWKWTDGILITEMLWVRRGKKKDNHLEERQPSLDWCTWRLIYSINLFLFAKWREYNSGRTWHAFKTSETLHLKVVLVDPWLQEDDIASPPGDGGALLWKATIENHTVMSVNLL